MYIISSVRFSTYKFLVEEKKLFMKEERKIETQRGIK